MSHEYCIYLCFCRWTLSSKRPQIWTTLRSYMKVGLPGCDWCTALCLWSGKGLEIHQSPVHLGCLKTSTQPLWGRKSEADASSALPNSWAPKMGQWPHSTTATTLPHPLAIGLTQRLMGLWSHLYFRGVRGGAVPAEGRGKCKGFISLNVEHIPPQIHSPLSTIFWSFWANQTDQRGTKREASFHPLLMGNHSRVTSTRSHHCCAWTPTPFGSVCESDTVGQEWRYLPTSISKEGKITMLLSAIQTDMLSCTRIKRKKSHLIRKGLCVLCIKLNVTLVGDSLDRCVVIIFLPLTCLFDTFAFFKHSLPISIACILENLTL